MLNNIMSGAECAELNRQIENAKNIVVCCHTSPDGDAVGSSLGFAEYLRSRGKNPSVIIPNAYPDFLKWLPGIEKAIRFDKHEDDVKQLFQKSDLVFCLDFNAIKRVEDMSDVLKSSKATKIMFDHHPGPELECTIAISRPEMCSTCEIVFRIIWQLGGENMMTRMSAIPIYCGMMTDTGGFTYNSTSPDIYFIISRLLAKGIDKDKIYRNVYNNYSEWRLRLMGYIMYEKLVVVSELHAAFFTLTKAEMLHFHFMKGDAEGLVNMPLQIKGMKLSISLREDTEKANIIRVSLRSVDDFSCNKVSEAFFNGGGHHNASGGELHCTMDEAVNVVKRALIHFEKELK